ncbi:hypothetical protein AB0N93_29930 [Streptomyces sp. NPDC091267]|uniref:hypothetical protein n=1 Tax=unclassified Streptomyces TaxID=2593676 RepID=UPI003424651B
MTAAGIPHPRSGLDRSGRVEAMREAGTDSGAVTARGLTGAHRLPELLEHLAS